MNRLFLSAALASITLVGSLHADGPDAATWKKSVGNAIAFLRKTQAEDGSWSRERSVGITGIVVTALMQSGEVSVDDPMVQKALKYIESLINREAGHIAGQGARVQLQNYVTCVNVMAFQAAGQPEKYQLVVKNAVEFLKKLQWDETEGKNPSDDFYGGAGYDSKSRPDLSNTQYFLDALQSAGIPKDDPALKKAMIFVSRCQNMKGEHNDQPWADKINDGSFIYSPAAGGTSKANDDASGPKPGYGSMTYAGVKSMIYAGLSKDDPRVKKAYEWITKNYSLEANPGMPSDRAHWGLFYYYHTMAKTLSVLGEKHVTDAKGVQHDWRKELVQTLSKKQLPNGSWTNENHWMEADPHLVTAYALLALGYCK